MLKHQPIATKHPAKIKLRPNFAYSAISFSKANLGDLIVATGLVILLYFESDNLIFCSPYNLLITWMASKKIGHIFQATSSFVHYLKAISELKLESHSENAQFRSKIVPLP